MTIRGVWIALVMAASIGCGNGSRASEQTEAPIWIVAPHPDDEALMASHLIARDASRTFVHLMTNGDLGCERDGWQRQRETLAAMRVLGVAPERVRFLSYPDGFLDALGVVPLPPRERRMEDGTCGTGATTYAHDVHSALNGHPGPYVADNAIGDLAALLARDRPRDVYVSHPYDDHPDHATTYILLRRAIERAMIEAPPRVHRAIVHAGGCWPNGSEPHEPCGPAGQSRGAPYPPLPGALARYVPNERIAVSDGGALGRRAIAEYRSQLHVDVEHDWLGDFARGDAIYWVESLVRDPMHPERLVRAPAEGASPQRVSFEAQVAADERATVRVEHDAGTRYAIEIVGDREVEVRGAGDRVLRRVHIPDDAARHAQHRWDLRIDPRPEEGGVVELEVRRDGALLAVLIDPQPYAGVARTVTDGPVDDVALVPEPR
ncbi:PIG-L family deacetylase [Sandaracinus amylolyticus]|uniref:PIG-L family deacetylase n=1 Tax=Sandaracinus amylolyticus TaxID=927083 RepID=UPI001F1BB136|nr:PIG-L family deacetylase [Sandaracinus amylolyticus]UJR82710.1 Hypothetical protein I5071_47750 [Sandaracinus amylolyticus]